MLTFLRLSLNPRIALAAQHASVAVLTAMTDPIKHEHAADDTAAAAVSPSTSLHSPPPPVTAFNVHALSASLSARKEREEQVGHIGWYMHNKRARVQEQFSAAVDATPQIAALVEEHHRTSQESTIAARSNDAMATAAMPHSSPFHSPSAVASHSPSSAAASSSSPARPLFAGVCIWINGLTNPGADTLRALLYTHGGRSENILVPGVTHWIAETIPSTKLKEVLTHPKHKPVVTPQWITESIRRGKRLPESEFMIAQLRGRMQPLLFGKANSNETAGSATQQAPAPPLVRAASAPSSPPSKVTAVSAASRNAPPSAALVEAPSNGAPSHAVSRSTSPIVPASTSALFTAPTATRFRSQVVRRRVGLSLPPSAATAAAPVSPASSLPIASAASARASSDPVVTPASVVPPSSPPPLEFARADSPIDLYLPATEEQTVEELGLPANAAADDEEEDGAVPVWQEDESMEDVDAMVAALDAAEQRAAAGRAGGGAAADGSNTPAAAAAALARQSSAPVAANVSSSSSSAAAPVAPPTSSSAASSRAALLAAAAAIGFHTSGRSTLTDPNFVPIFFQQSRLHFLGSWGKHFETLLPSLQLITPRFDNKSQSSAGASFFAAPSAASAASSSGAVSGIGNRVVLHIDMDCFFVSVAIRSDPSLKDKPVVVCHSKGTASADQGNGSSSISSASYAARKFGIKAETTLGKALSLCPDLVVKPYDFESYIAVSEEVYRVFFSYTHLVQSVSCDEAYLEFPAGTDGFAIAEEIRAEVLRRTGCPCSAGIGPSMLLARLATNVAKPAKSYRIGSGREEIHAALRDAPLSSLQGVGHVLKKKLDELSLKTCGDILSTPHVTKAWLQSNFGAKTGEMLWNSAHGLDPRALAVEKTKKTLGADVNYGLRFLTAEPVQIFISEVCAEVLKRLRVYRLKGSLVTVKAKKRSAGAPMETTWKFLGHGVCDNYSKSLSVKSAIGANPKTDQTTLSRIAQELYLSFGIVPHDLRGFGVQIGGLESVGPAATTGASAASLESLHRSEGNETDTAQRQAAAAYVVHQHQASSSIIVASRQPSVNSQQSSASPHKLSKYAANALSAASFAAPLAAPSPPPASAASVSAELSASAASASLSPHKHRPHRTSPRAPLRPPPACESPVPEEPEANVAIAEASATDVTMVEPSAVVEPPVEPPPQALPTNAATGTSTAASTAAPFVFVEVTKPPRDLDSELSVFPPFSELDKNVIAELPMDVRKDLASIYKAKRAAETAKQAAETSVAPAAALAPAHIPPRLTPAASAVADPIRRSSPEPANHAPSVAPPSVAAAAAASSTAVDLTHSEVLPSVSRTTAAAPTAAASRAPVSAAHSSHADELDWSQIDRSVLDELPRSIRSELEAEQRRRKQSQLVILAPSSTHGANNKKRKGTSSNAAAPSHSSSASDKSSKPVKVLNIAAHFLQMEKKQKRGQTAASATATNARKPAEPPARPFTIAAAAPRVAPAAASSAAAAAAAAVSSDSISLTQLRGFNRVDPRKETARYAAAAAAIPSAALSTRAASPCPPEIIEIEESPSIEDAAAAPASPAPVPDVPEAPLVDDTGVVAMELDSDVSQNPRHIKQEPEVEVEKEQKAEPVFDQAAAVMPVALPGDRSPSSLHPVSHAFPELHAALPVISEVAESMLDGSASDAFDPGVQCESFAELRPWFHEWITGVAVRPLDQHVQLLLDLCSAQLIRHHNLSLVQSILEHLHKLARGDWSLLTDEQRAFGHTWRFAFNHLLRHLQPIVQKLFQGRLHCEPFEE